MKKKIRIKPVKLIELLRTLDRKEFNAFGRYVKAMVKDENVHKLFLELKKYAPAFEVGQKEREKIFKKIFGNIKYNNRQLNYLTSAMNLHLEEYLITLIIRKNEKQRSYMLMEYFKDRNQFEYFERTAEDVLSKENIRDIHDGEYYLTKMKIEYDLYHHIENNNKRIKKQAGRIGKLVTSLDEFYMFYKLNMVSDLTAFGEAYNIESNIYLLINEIQQAIKDHPIHENILVQIYMFVVNNFKEHTFENFIELKNRVYKVIDKLSERYQKNLYTCLSNYAIMCHRVGIPNFQSHLFEIQKMGIDKEYALTNGELSFQSFINAIVMATNIDIFELDWAKQIIQTKGHYVSKDVREDSLLLANAYINYAEEDYEKALLNLNFVQKWRQYSFSAQGRILLLKCYYELDYEYAGRYLEVAEYSADAYRNFMKRSQIFNVRTIQSVDNFTKLTIRIMRNKFTKKESKEELQGRLNNQKIIASKSWIKEKIHEHLQRKYRYNK